MVKYIVLDVETKNLGSDIMEDNERLLSIQLGDAHKQELYYADSKDPRWTLAMGEKQIAALSSQGYTFAGYNIMGFDTTMLKKFRGIEIPESKLFDICQSPRLTQFTNKKRCRMEEACRMCGVDASHKPKMDKRAEKYLARQDIKEQAKVKAEDLVKNKGWDPDFAFKYVLEKIAGGHAIYETYVEFVENGGRKDAFFYEYAIGDVISEYNLLKALKY